jgi:outer membrane protein assembly factor BamE (lipoprotein component of BamABCDE complex)
MKKIFKLLTLTILSFFILQGCTTQVIKNSSADKNITVGTVQKEIKVGMSAADVVVVLGSPNIVTSNDIDGETWVYDKISQEVSYANDSAYGTLILIGGSSKSGSSSTSQRTLTIVITFDNRSKVTKVKYHTSRF